MPTIELLAEVELLKKQLTETEAAARMYCERTVKAEGRLEELLEIKKERSNYTLCHNQILKQLKERAEGAEDRLAELKKDARMLATWTGSRREINSAIQRILEATEEP
jgi:undecaprenyl pyrophosphate synthase